MSAKIKTFSQAEVQELIHDANRKITYKMVPHQWKTSKNLPKPYCNRCGLLDLNNDLSRWAISKGCLNAEHSGYASAIKRYSKTKIK